MVRPKALIFDFDGTLADTFHIAVSVFRSLARKKFTDDEHIEKLRGLPAKQALWLVGVRWWNLPYVVYRGRKAVKQHMESGSVRAIAGMEPVLNELHARGYGLFVVSSNSKKNIERFLKLNSLDQYFDEVYGGIGVFSKSEILATIARDRRLNITDCRYVGDEVRDIDAAKKAGMGFVGVTWGYNNRVALEKAKAERLVDTPKELLALFKGKSK